MERERVRADRRYDREREMRLENASHDTRSRLSVRAMVVVVGG